MRPPADQDDAAKAAYVRSFNQAVDTTLASTRVKELLELPVGQEGGGGVAAARRRKPLGRVTHQLRGQQTLPCAPRTRTPVRLHAGGNKGGSAAEVGVELSQQAAERQGSTARGR